MLWQLVFLLWVETGTILSDPSRRDLRIRLSPPPPPLPLGGYPISRVVTYNRNRRVISAQRTFTVANVKSHYVGSSKCDSPAVSLLFLGRAHGGGAVSFSLLPWFDTFRRGSVRADGRAVGAPMTQKSPFSAKKLCLANLVCIAAASVVLLAL